VTRSGVEIVKGMMLPLSLKPLILHLRHPTPSNMDLPLRIELPIDNPNFLSTVTANLTDVITQQKELAGEDLGHGVKLKPQVSAAKTEILALDRFILQYEVPIHVEGSISSGTGFILQIVLQPQWSDNSKEFILQTPTHDSVPQIIRVAELKLLHGSNKASQALNAIAEPFIKAVAWDTIKDDITTKVQAQFRKEVRDSLKSINIQSAIIKKEKSKAIIEIQLALPKRNATTNKS
jgi:hypothetical protein